MFSQAQPNPPPHVGGYNMRDALKKHWPEYLMEAAGLGIFMGSASVFTILLYHPASPALRVLPEEFPRRGLVGPGKGVARPRISFPACGKPIGAHLHPPRRVP